MSSEASTRLIFGLGDKIRVSPAIWPEHRLNLQPGDLSKIAPYGNGVYGYQDRNGNPFTGAPSQEACGGIVYFGNDISEADFRVLMRIMEVKSSHATVKISRAFAVFTAESNQPSKDGYLAQMRIVSKFGLRFMFGALTAAEYEKFPEQEITVVEALWSFVQQERQRWGASFQQDGKKGLQGLFGGDGDFAREELSFGFMPENNYHRVCRIWSRAWLVTK